jgi:hypothetical protein
MRPLQHYLRYVRRYPRALYVFVFGMLCCALLLHWWS